MAATRQIFGGLMIDRLFTARGLLIAAFLTAYAPIEALCYTPPIVVLGQEFCAGIPDGGRTIVTARPDKNFEFIGRLTVTCTRGTIEGSGILEFADDDNRRAALSYLAEIDGLDEAARIEGHIARVSDRVMFRGPAYADIRGPVTAYYRSGALLFAATVGYLNVLGEYTVWHPDGSVRERGQFGDNGTPSGGRKQGKILTWHPGGAGRSIEYFCYGFPIGRHWHYDEGGNISFTEDFSQSAYGRRHSEFVRNSLASDGTVLSFPALHSKSEFDPAVRILWAAVLRRTVAGNGEERLAVTDWPQRGWFLAIPGTRFDDLFVTNGTATFEHVGRATRVSFRVRPYYAHQPFEADVRSGVGTNDMHTLMLRECHKWIPEAFGATRPQ